MKEQYFFVREVKHGRGMADLSRDKTEMSRYKALHTGHPPYLADLLQLHTTPKSTRSSSSQLLFVPRHNLSFGSTSFRVSAPKVWNILPFHTRQSQSLFTVEMITVSSTSILL